MEKLRVLFVEDNRFDVELMLSEFQSGGFDVSSRVVVTEVDFRHELAGDVDVVICDHDLPTFDALTALRVFSRMRRDIPFIVVSGTIREELAVECMKQGASDYLLKDRLIRLPMAVRQARSRCILAKLAAESEELLKIREDQYRSLVDGITDHAIILLAPDGSLVMANSALETLYGYRPSEFIGRSILTLLGMDASDTNGRVADWLAGNDSAPSTEFELIQERRNGSSFVATVALSVISSDERGFRGYSCVIKDVTERIVAKQHLAETLEQERASRVRSELLYDEAQKNARLKDEFLATLSHELRTPLGVIIGWVDMLRRKHATLDECIEIIHRNANAQLKLVDDVLDMSRIISKKLQLNLEVHDIGKVVEDVVESLRIQAKSKQLAFDITIGQGISAVVCDSARLQQIMWNLISNAIKFSESNGVVAVAAESCNGDLILTVTDKGQGIDPRFLPHVFERFRQEDGSSERKGAGLGLGLAIVKHLVELHGGAVQAQSAGKGHGAAFRVSIPARRHIDIGDRGGSEAEAKANWREATNPTLGGPSEGPEDKEEDLKLDNVRVLIIDDDASSLEVEQAMVKNHVGDVIGVQSALEALEFLESNSVDVIVCDVGMAEMDGHTFIRKYREIEARRDLRTPAVALTAYAYDSERVRAFDAGFDAFLVKPTSLDDLLQTMKKIQNHDGNHA